MRKYLRESREKFAGRFFMSADAIKKYETDKREPWGPVIVILGQIEAEIEGLKEERRKSLENVRNGHLARLTEKALGEKPERHKKWNKVASLRHENKDLGPVEVFECRCPAAYFRIEFDGVAITTGSGSAMAELADQIAQALARDTLTIETLKKGQAV